MTRGPKSTGEDVKKAPADRDAAGALGLADRNEGFGDQWNQFYIKESAILRLCQE
jgi:hypothetical protein